MADFKDIFVTFALVGLFVFAMLSFVYITQQDNNVDTILENDLMNRTYQGLNTNLSAFRSDSQTQRENFESDVPTAGFGSLLIFSIVSAGKVFTGMIVAVFNLIVVLPATFLGISPIVMSVLSSILITLIVLGLWRLYKLGG